MVDADKLEDDIMTKTMLAAMAGLIAAFSVSIVTVAANVDGFSSPDRETVIEKRRKPRIKGGSGCDDPDDVIEHPECR